MKVKKDIFGSTSFNAEENTRIEAIQIAHSWNRAQTLRMLALMGADAMERKDAENARIASGSTQIDPAFFGVQA